MLTRNFHGVMIAPHSQDSDMLEIYTNKGGKNILWGVVHAEILEELRGNITLQDLENSEYELCIHAPNGFKK